MYICRNVCVLYSSNVCVLYSSNVCVLYSSNVHIAYNIRCNVYATRLSKDINPDVYNAHDIAFIVYRRRAEKVPKYSIQKP